MTNKASNTNPATEQNNSIEQTTSNPFVFTATDVKNSTTRKLDYTPVLIDRANQRASELMMSVTQKPELFETANYALDSGEPTDLIDLIMAVYDADQINSDAQVLAGCDADQLSRLLESRRSDRSKAKHKGPRTNVQVCKTYISSMYAELMIRDFWNKPYVGTQTVEVNTSDMSAVSKKIKSLQSKKCRLRKIAQYDVAARDELAEVAAEIDRLNSLRPTSRIVTKSIVKDLQVEQLREILKRVDPTTLSADDQAKFEDLMVNLG